MPQLSMPRQTRAPQQIAAVSVFLPLALAAVILRIWIRSRMINSLGWDDIMMVVALVNFIMYDLALMVIVGHGGGTHLRSPDNLRVALNWTLVAEIFYLITLLFLKLSLGLFFLRVVIKKWQRKTVYTAMAVSTVINIYHCFFVIFSCGDPRLYLEHTLERTCVRKSVEVGLAYEQAAVTMITDWVFALLPIPLLWNASMDRRSKLSVGLILSLGAFGSICSIVRFKYIDSLGDRNDFFWNAANVSIWSTIEMGTGIIAGCLATMRPLFKKIMYRAVHITHVAAGHGSPRSKSSSSWKGKSVGSTARSNSNPSFHDWKESINRSTGTYTTSCVGGRDLDLENETLADEKGAHMLKIQEETEEVWTKEPEQIRVWPFGIGEGISKVVDVQISVTREHPASGEMWNQSMEEIQIPKRTRKGSRDDDIPEWDKLPDLIPPERPGTSSSKSCRSMRSGSKSPTLYRVPTK